LQTRDLAGHNFRLPASFDDRLRGLIEGIPVPPAEHGSCTQFRQLLSDGGANSPARAGYYRYLTIQGLIFLTHVFHEIL
jgi:hypothetical protein